MIYFCYRDTIDWKKKQLKIDFFLDRKQIKKSAEVQYREYKDVINKWNKINNIDYFEFRNILKIISKKTFKDSAIEEINSNDILSLNDDDWVIPFDDDDWFCESFKQKIDSEQDANFLYGDVVRYFIHDGKFILNEGDKKKCKILQSCQYAIKAKELKKMNVESFNNVIKRHYTVRYEIKNNKLKEKYFKEIISSRIMHNAQHSVLFSGKNMKKNNFLFTEPPLFANWCKPYVNLLNNYINRFYI